MKTGLTISASAHAAVLLWALVSFAPKALNAPPTESMPVDLISSTEFSQLRAGARNAPKAETPKPLVEKIAEKKTPADPAAKVVDKPELVTASAQTPPPADEKIPERKATETKEPKSEPKPDATSDVAGKGYLQIFSKPAAKILIDGADTGMSTPISGHGLALGPGKHKVTFVMGDDRYTFPVMIKVGATETMSKDLQ